MLELVPRWQHFQQLFWREGRGHFLEEGVQSLLGGGGVLGLDQSLHRGSPDRGGGSSLVTVRGEGAGGLAGQEEHSINRERLGNNLKQHRCQITNVVRPQLSTLYSRA